MLGYSAIGVVMVALLIYVASSKMQPGMEVTLAQLVVVVLPMVTILTLTHRSKKAL